MSAFDNLIFKLFEVRRDSLELYEQLIFTWPDLSDNFIDNLCTIDKKITQIHTMFRNMLAQMSPNETKTATSGLDSTTVIIYNIAFRLHNLQSNKIPPEIDDPSQFCFDATVYSVVKNNNIVGYDENLSIDFMYEIFNNEVVVNPNVLDLGEPIPEIVCDDLDNVFEY